MTHGVHRHTVFELLKGEPLEHTMEEKAVRLMRGDCDATFNEIDKDKNGYISRKEFTDLVKEAEVNPDEKDIEALLKKLDTDGDGKITIVEFRTWYKNSEKRITKDADLVFAKISEDGGKTIARKDVAKCLGLIDRREYDDKSEIVEKALRDYLASDNDRITQKAFHDYFVNYHMDSAKEANKEAGEEEVGGLDISWPSTTRAQIVYICTLPLIAPMYFTCPNVQNDRWKRWWPFSFFMSIIWVAIYSILMVQWATVLGLTVNIPPKVMGLIFLAAGTSIPDLLTSVCVAMKGNGDMAVSSSIGSNIFDILVGLPLPWICKSAYDAGLPVIVGTSEGGGVGVSVIILFSVVVIVLLTVAGVGWKLNKSLAFVFFFFYLVYITQELARYYTSDEADSGSCL